MIRFLLRKTQPLLHSYINWYYRKPRLIHKRNVQLMLYPTVFHPSLYHSTDILLDYMLTLDIEDKHILELGCGNGFISLYLAKNRNVTVHASDINEVAIQGLYENMSRNQVEIISYVSDLFSSIPDYVYDYILVNPPYYPQSPNTDQQRAFFAGQDFEYFTHFFDQLPSYIDPQKTHTYFVLSDNNYLDPIQSIAANAGYQMKVVYKDSKLGETFIVFEIVSLI